MLEAFFHVSTMMVPSAADGDERDGAESLYKRRWAHIGNDPVHIVWSEREVDYDFTVLPTQVSIAVVDTSGSCTHLHACISLFPTVPSTHSLT